MDTTEHVWSITIEKNTLILLFKSQLHSASEIYMYEKGISQLVSLKIAARVVKTLDLVF